MYTDWELHKLTKNCFNILKKSPATFADYLQAEDLHELYQGKSLGYLLLLKLCG